MCDRGDRGYTPHAAAGPPGDVACPCVGCCTQLGNGTTSYATRPEPVVGLEGVAVADVAAGGWHSMAISADGEVFVFGRGEYGRLGLGDRSGTSKLRPQKVRALEGHRVVEGSCGGTHTMVVTDEGRCFIWGRAAFGRWGGGRPALPAARPLAGWLSPHWAPRLLLMPAHQT